MTKKNPIESFNLHGPRRIVYMVKLIVMVFQPFKG